MRLRDLGSLVVEVDGVSTMTGGSKPARLLSMLLVNANRRVPVDALLTAVWGEQAGESAVGTMESHIWRLRKAMEPHRSARQPPTHLVNDSYGHRLVVNSDNVLTASVTFEGTQRIGQLTINNGGTATLPAGGAKVLTITSLSMGIVGTLNLTNNDMILDYLAAPSPIATIQSLIGQGRGTGAWNTSGGITTSFGNAATFALGYAEASDVAPGGTFSGQPVDGTAVLVKFTFYADANLDGKVDVSDLGRLATNWQGSSRRWAQGDFNYNSTVNVTDLGLLASNWQAGIGSPLSKGVSAQPETKTVEERSEEALTDVIE